MHTIQIATPFSIGAGVVWATEGVVLTAATLVGEHRTVVVSSPLAAPYEARVLLTDAAHDVALVEWLPSVVLPPLVAAEQVAVGAVVTIASLSPALRTVRLTTTISEMTTFGNNHFIKIADIVDGTMYGAAAFDAHGGWLGMATMLRTEASAHGYLLHQRHLAEVVEAYRPHLPAVVVQCEACQRLSPAPARAGGVCAHCGGRLPRLAAPDAPAVLGVVATLETVIANLGYNVSLTRRGAATWVLKQGSATILLAYYEPQGCITADAFLCHLPTADRLSVALNFLLRQNNRLYGLTFSIKDGDIVLSFLIFDRHFQADIFQRRLADLLAKADYFDNVLVEEYGATWKSIY